MESTKEKLKMFPATNYQRNARSSVWSAQMMRVVIDVVNKHKPVEFRGKEANSDKVANLIRDGILKLPEDKHNNLSVQQIKKKLGKFTRSTVDGADVNSFAARGGEILDFSKLPVGILSPEEYEEWVANRATKVKSKSTKEKAQQQPSANRSEGPEDDNDEQTENNTEGMDRNRAALKGKLIAIGQSSLMRDTTSPASIKRDMKAIYDQICRTVEDRLEETGIDADKTIPDILLPPSSPPWDDVLEIITGSKRPRFEPGLPEIKKMQHENQIRLDYLLTSIIAAAVTVWALRPHPLEDLLGPAYHTLLAGFEELDKQGASLVAEDVRAKLLKEQVRPEIPGRATSLAEDVDKLLGAYLIPTHSSRTTKYGVSAGPVLIAHHDDTDDEQPRRKRVKYTEPQWAIDWRQELERIFTMGLELRVSLEMKGSGRYRFEFPASGDTMSVANGKAHVDQTVFLGLFPGVEASFQEVNDGEWSDWEQVVDSVVDFADSNDRLATQMPAARTGKKQGESVVEVPDSSDLSELESEDGVNDQDGSFNPNNGARRKAGKKRKGAPK